MNYRRLWDIRYGNKIYYHNNICEQLEEYITNIKTKNISNVLDFGCGPGRLINYFVDDPIKLDLYDNSEIVKYNISQICKNYSNIQLIDSYENLEHKKYDSIICHRVLHSTPDYKQYLDLFNRILKSNQSLFLSVRSTLCEEYKRRNNDITNNIYINKEKYIKFFTKQELIDICVQNDFHIEETGEFIEKSTFVQKENTYVYVVITNKK